MKKLIVLLILICAFPISASAESEDVAMHKYYALVTPAASGYADDGRKLTDGIYAERIQSGAASYYYKSDAYVGFSAVDAVDGSFVIICDLGEIRRDLCLFEISLLNETDIGIYMPKTVTVAVADQFDGTYRDVGVYLSNEPSVAGVSQTVIATVTPPSAVSGRFVRFTLSHLVDDYGWVFADEISVYTSDPMSEASAVDTLAGDSSVAEVPQKKSNSLLPWIIIGVGFGLVVFTALRSKPHGID